MDPPVESSGDTRISSLENKGPNILDVYNSVLQRQAAEDYKFMNNVYYTKQRHYPGNMFKEDSQFVTFDVLNNKLSMEQYINEQRARQKLIKQGKLNNNHNREFSNYYVPGKRPTIYTQTSCLTREQMTAAYYHYKQHHFIEENFQSQVLKENQEFQSYVEQLWRSTNYHRAMNIDPNVRSIIDDYWQTRISECKTLYPSVYRRHSTVPLTLSEEESSQIHLTHVADLHSEGSCHQLVLPMKMAFEQRLTTEPEAFASWLQYERKGLSFEDGGSVTLPEDPLAESLALGQNCQVVMTTSSVRTLLNNHADNHYAASWMIPVQVKLMIDPQTGLERKVVFIDKKLTHRQLTKAQKVFWFSKMAVKKFCFDYTKQRKFFAQDSATNRKKTRKRHVDNDRLGSESEVGVNGGHREVDESESEVGDNGGDPEVEESETDGSGVHEDRAGMMDGVETAIDGDGELRDIDRIRKRLLQEDKTDHKPGDKTESGNESAANHDKVDTPATPSRVTRSQIKSLHNSPAHQSITSLNIQSTVGEEEQCAERKEEVQRKWCDYDGFGSNGDSEEEMELIIDEPEESVTHPPNHFPPSTSPHPPVTVRPSLLSQKISQIKSELLQIPDQSVSTQHKTKQQKQKHKISHQQNHISEHVQTCPLDPLTQKVDRTPTEAMSELCVRETETDAMSEYRKLSNTCNSRSDISTTQSTHHQPPGNSQSTYHQPPSHSQSTHHQHPGNSQSTHHQLRKHNNKHKYPQPINSGPLSTQNKPTLGCEQSSGRNIHLPPSDYSQEPSGRNRRYSLWRLFKEYQPGSEMLKNTRQPLSILVKSKLDGQIVAKESTTGVNQSPYLCVLPKVEYQNEYGAEVSSLHELLNEWITLYMKPNSELLRVRVAHDNLEVIMTETRKQADLFHMIHDRHKVNPRLLVGNLYSVLWHLIDLPVGQYLLDHEPRTTAFVNVYQADTKGSHFPMAGWQCSEGILRATWRTIDTSVLTPGHEHERTLPAVFPPSDQVTAIKRNYKKHKNESYMKNVANLKKKKKNAQKANSRERKKKTAATVKKKTQDE